jgi:hypothetical protein
MGWKNSTFKEMRKHTSEGSKNNSFLQVIRYGKRKQAEPCIAPGEAKKKGTEPNATHQ